jgi:uncharacterized protein with HEPN domain
MGEAVKKLSPGFKKTYRDIESKKIAGLSDKIIRYYFGVNWDVLWDVIKRRIPTLKEQIEKILKEAEGYN